MDLETVIQSEVSQKEKNKYCILTHNVESRKIVQVNLFAKQKQTQTYRTNIWIPRGEEGADELGDWD